MNNYPNKLLLDPSPSANEAMYDLAKRLFPFPRSLTGDGVRRTLAEVQTLLPNLQVAEVDSGTRAFDWEVPQEWNIRDAYVLDESGRKVIDINTTNLHVIAYSVPVDEVVTREELDKHLYSLPDQPDVVPFVQSYYKRRWGFAIAHRERMALPRGNYRVVIDSTLQPGKMTYGELVLPGSEEKEVLLSTYFCHPSMANDNLSGICVTVFLAQWLARLQDRRYTYRILFIPETIGSIWYLSANLEHMRSKTIAGFVLTCCGDERQYSFLPSRKGETLADRAALHVLRHHAPEFKHYSFLERGSDERQYCSPGIDLPVVSLMRSKYHEYPEYHTSNDDLSLISPAGLGGAYDAMRKTIAILEQNYTYRSTVLCEPQLGKRGLYPTISIKGSTSGIQDMINLLAYCDGTLDLIGIAETIGAPAWQLVEIADRLLDANVIERC
ncbi:MAG: aminopeptidase [Thiotrichales bacterium SG8_50]|nr:MAG: aminopeptidase [Thiotrichales bacterium SG8_50]